MTHTKIIQYIIQELNASSFTWGPEEELFEKMFFPIPYGNKHSEERNSFKKPIKDLFKGKEFSFRKFDKLANHIPCGNNEKSRNYRSQLKSFVENALREQQIEYDIDNLNQLLEKLICTEDSHKNYRSQFDNWKNIQNNNNIDSQAIKTALQTNFNLPVTIWDQQTDANQIVAIKKGVDFFLKKSAFKEDNPNGIYPYTKNLFDEINLKYKAQYTTTDTEKDDLIRLKKMNEKEIMQYIHDNYPLSQAILLKMIPELFDKGFYTLLLDDGIEALDLVLRNDTTIKKIRAHALGSQEVAKYDEAYELLSSINSNDDNEIVDMRTSAISNMRRFQLTDKTLEKEKLQKILTTIIDYYKIAFDYNESFHYYPGVNLAYMFYLEKIIFDKNNSIKEIYEKAKESIELDKSSSDIKKQYYANISNIELLLLSQDSSFQSRMQEYLYELDLTVYEEKSIYIPLLEITQRQFHFIIDIAQPYSDTNNTIYTNLEKALNLIKSKIEYS